MLLAFNKPYGVLSQFTPDGSRNRTLKEFGFPAQVYPLGRLDADSEGLLLLSDEPGLNTRLLLPRHAHEREYWVQVEQLISPESLQELARGVLVQGRRTQACRAWTLEEDPRFAERQPPIRYRKRVPTCWIGLELVEGRNRQVRRMTAAVGHPTLRLVRVRIGQLRLEAAGGPGRWRELTQEERDLIFQTRLQRFG